MCNIFWCRNPFEGPRDFRKLVQIVKILIFLSLIVVALNFQDVFIFAMHEVICVMFLVEVTHLGAPGTRNLRIFLCISRVGPICLCQLR